MTSIKPSPRKKNSNRTPTPPKKYTLPKFFIFNPQGPGLFSTLRDLGGGGSPGDPRKKSPKNTVTNVFLACNTNNSHFNSCLKRF